ncbi:glutamine synthetase, partial [Candidatus Woesearchaeota archaeon]|nr:glutamine synthetase [Candidatus Woesearchaeota archaeon]
KHDAHIAVNGDGIQQRLTGIHETASYKEFSAGVSDRGASIRIPWQVAVEHKGYLEDRRPCANADPYVVEAMVMKTVMGK